MAVGRWLAPASAGKLPGGHRLQSRIRPVICVNSRLWRLLRCLRRVGAEIKVCGVLCREGQAQGPAPTTAKICLETHRGGRAIRKRAGVSAKSEKTLQNLPKTRGQDNYGRLKR